MVIIMNKDFIAEMASDTCLLHALEPPTIATEMCGSRAAMLGLLCEHHLLWFTEVL